MLPFGPDGGRVLTRLLVIAALLIGTAAYLRAASRPEQIPAREVLSALPLTLGPWAGSSAPELDDEVLDILGVDDYITRVYRDTSAAAGPLSPIGLYVGYYTSQRQGDTIHSPMNCLPGAGWQPVDVATVPIPLDGGPPAVVNRVVIQKGESRQVALYWYQGRGRIVANEYLSKAYLVWDAATRHRTDGALIRVVSPVAAGEPDTTGAEQRAVAFAAALYPSLSRFLPE